MINKEQALKLVQDYLDTMSPSDTTDRYVVVHSSTIEKHYGWVFIFNSQKFLETKNIFLSLGGNGPIIVEKHTGELHQLGSAMSLENAIREFEERKGVTHNIRLCPRCEQGDIVSATIKKTGKTIFVCKECEATWFCVTEIDSKEFIDFGNYMESINLSPTWDELENIFRIS